MASLTSYDNSIAGVQSGAVKIADKTSPFESIFAGVNTGLEALSQKRYADNLDAAAETRNGLDYVAGQTFQADVSQENTMPPDVIKGVQTLNNAQAGVDQGTVPPAAYKVKLQQIGTDAIAKYPSAAAEIANYFRTSGHDHVMFANLEAQQAQVTSQRNAVLQGQASDYQYYIEKGGLPNTSYDQAVSSGQQMRRADTLAAQAKQKAIDARENLTLTTSQSEAMRKAGERDAVQSVTEHVDANVTPIFDHFRELYTSANGNPAQMEKLDQTILPLLDNMSSQAMAAAHKQLLDSHNWSKETKDAADDYIDSQLSGIKATFADKSGAMQRTLQNLNATMGIDIAKGAPLLSRMSKLVGPQTAALMLDQTTLLDPKIRGQLSKEINGVSSTADGQMHLSNVISILKGDKNLADFDEKTAASYIGGIVTGKKASEAAILNGSAKDVDRQVYSNSLSNVMNAAHQLTPHSDIGDLKSATRLIATPQSRQALDAMAKDPSTAEQASALGLASHLTGVKLLQNLKSTQEQKNTFLGASRSDPNTSIVFNPAAGVYEAKVKPGSGVAGPGKENLDRVAILNQALDHAVKTSKWDPELPKATPLALRKFYAIGTPLEAPKTADGKPQQTPEQMWDASETQLEARLRQFPTLMQAETNTQERDAVMKPASPEVQNQQIDKIETFAGKFAPKSISKGDFAELAKAVAMQESRLNPDAVSPTGVRGTMQLTKGTAKMYGMNRDDNDQNIEGGVRYLAHLVDAHHGDVNAALMEYNGGSDPIYDKNVLRWLGKVKKQEVKVASE